MFHNEKVLRDGLSYVPNTLAQAPERTPRRVRDALQQLAERARVIVVSTGTSEDEYRQAQDASQAIFDAFDE